MLHHSSCFRIWTIINNAAITFVSKFLCGHMFSVLLGIHLGVELLGHIVTMFNFLRNDQLCFKMAAPFYILTSKVWGVPISPHLHHHLLLSIFFFFFKYSYLRGCEVLSHGGFDFHFPNDLPGVFAFSKRQCFNLQKRYHHQPRRPD